MSSTIALHQTIDVDPGGPAQQQQLLLVVDDDEPTRRLVSRFLRARGYDVDAVGSGAEALDVLRSVQHVAMLCDLRMPGMSGMETLRRALVIDPDLVVLVLTGVNDAATATDALGGGAMDYIIKPFVLPALVGSIERALHRRERAIEQRGVELRIREEVALRTAEVEQEKLALRALNVSSVETLVNAMEAKDVYLRGHSLRVAELASAIAERLGLSPETVDQVRLAGRLHDVGKIGIRETVLNKPARLTTVEFAHVQEHVRIAMDILQPLKHLGPALDFVRDHHERWDGSGYPRGLRGEEITIGGRILAAADAFDALTSKRAYRDPVAPDQVIAFLGASEVARLLDPAVYDALASVVLGRGAAPPASADGDRR